MKNFNDIIQETIDNFVNESVISEGALDDIKNLLKAFKGKSNMSQDDVRKERKLKEYPPKDTHLYQYKGPVKQFGKCVISNFSAATQASSEAKAKQNIIFQAKRHLGLQPYAGGFKLVADFEGDFWGEFHPYISSLSSHSTTIHSL